MNDLMAIPCVLMREAPLKGRFFSATIYPATSLRATRSCLRRWDLDILYRSTEWAVPTP